MNKLILILALTLPSLWAKAADVNEDLLLDHITRNLESNLSIKNRFPYLRETQLPESYKVVMGGARLGFSGLSVNPFAIAEQLIESGQQDYYRYQVNLTKEKANYELVCTVKLDIFQEMDTRAWRYHFLVYDCDIDNLDTGIGGSLSMPYGGAGPLKDIQQ